MVIVKLGKKGVYRPALPVVTTAARPPKAGARAHNCRFGTYRSEAMLTADKERVSARIPRESRKLLEKAAALSGATLNQFVMQAAVKEAQTDAARARADYRADRGGLVHSTSRK